jgi:hypothetical protein
MLQGLRVRNGAYFYCQAGGASHFEAGTRCGDLLLSLGQAAGLIVAVTTDQIALCRRHNEQDTGTSPDAKG